MRTAASVLQIPFTVFSEWLLGRNSSSPKHSLSSSRAAAGSGDADASRSSSASRLPSTAAGHSARARKQLEPPI